MFNTMKTARKIREARIAQNMPQMNLADAMEVSYQAVSSTMGLSSLITLNFSSTLCTISCGRQIKIYSSTFDVELRPCFE